MRGVIRPLEVGHIAATLFVILLFAFPALCLAQPIPQVISTSPTQNELNIPVDVDIEVTFDTEMDETTFNETSVLVHGHSTGLHPGVIAYDDPSRTVTFNPDNDFHAGEIVTVVLTTDIESAEGSGLADGHFLSFTVAVSPWSPGVFTPLSLYTVGDWPQSIVAADFDGDGFLDLAAGNHREGNVSIIFNDGSGAFGSHTILPIGSGAVMGILAGDLDADGDMDLAVNTNLSVFERTNILLNNGDGSFAPNVSYSVSGEPWGDPAFGDIDADGAPDVVCAIPYEDLFCVLWGNGDGTFQASGYAVTGIPAAVAVADFNGDGELDVVTANAGSDEISVSFHDYGHVFTNHFEYQVGEQPNDICAIDFNGDGHLDLATANKTSNDVSVLFNNGDGTFTPPTSYPVSQHLKCLSSGDLDGDGDQDLTVGYYDGYYIDGVEILANNGDSTFTIIADYHVGNTPHSIFSADLDRDGDLDLATVLGFSIFAATFLNQVGLVIDTTEIEFYTVARTNNPDPQALLIESNDVALNFEIAVDASWLSVDPPSGTTPATVTISVDITGLEAGEHYGYLTITSGDAENSPQTVRVRLWLWPLNLTFHPDTLEVVVTVGDPSPAARGFFVTNNAGTGVNIPFSLSEDVDWLTLPEPSGTTPAYVPADVDFAGLPLGFYTTAITCTSPEADNSPAALAVELTINPLELAIDSATIDFYARAGDSNPPDKSFTVASNGSQFDFEITKDADWLTIYPSSGTTPSTIYASVDISGLDAGVHTGIITVSAADADNSPQTIEVVLVVDHILSIYPEPNDLNIPGSANISVTYGVDMDSTTLTDANFTIRGNLSGFYGGALDYDPETKIATFNPVIDFIAGELITVTLTAGIESTAGSPLIKGLCWSFTVEVSARPIEYGFRTDYLVGTGIGQFIAADFNGDHRPDLATIMESSAVAVLINNGDGTFADRVDYPGLELLSSLEAVDSDRDGDLDLALQEFLIGNVCVLANNGDGTFADVIRYPVNSYSQYLTTADFNADGHVDLATNYLTILMNTGDGTFAPGIDYPLGGENNEVVAADFDVDGDFDLATCSGIAPTTSFAGVIFNDGSGVFTISDTYPTGEIAEAITVADLDADRYVDMVVTNINTDDISVFINAGDGTFAGAVNYPSGRALYAICTGDLDGDGDQDLAAADWDSNGVFVLLNSGDGTFVHHAVYAVADDPNSIMAVDLNGDGYLDLVTGNRSENNISVLLNGPCDCSSFCDLNPDDQINPLDVVYMVNYVYKGLDARPILPACPGDNGDWDCNGSVNPLDVTWYVQYVYKQSGVGPCDPCEM